MNRTETILLLTRPLPAARRFQQLVEARIGGFGRVILSPVLRIDRLATPIAPDPDRVFLFTSANAVEALPPDALAPVPAWCVGERTAAAARAAGFLVSGVAPDADGLMRMLRDRRPKGRFLHAAGRHRRVPLAERLTEAGLPAATVSVYDQRAVPLTDAARAALNGGQDIVAPLFSPRSARLLADAAAGRTAPVHVAAISAAALDAWPLRAGERHQIAARPDAEAVIEAMGRLFDAAGFA